MALELDAWRFPWIQFEIEVGDETIRCKILKRKMLRCRESWSRLLQKYTAWICTCHLLNNVSSILKVEIAALILRSDMLPWKDEELWLVGFAMNWRSKWHSELTVCIIFILNMHVIFLSLSLFWVYEVLSWNMDTWNLFFQFQPWPFCSLFSSWRHSSSSSTKLSMIIPIYGRHSFLEKYDLLL